MNFKLSLSFSNRRKLFRRSLKFFVFPSKNFRFLASTSVGRTFVKKWTVSSENGLKIERNQTDLSWSNFNGTFSSREKSSEFPDLKFCLKFDFRFVLFRVSSFRWPEQRVSFKMTSQKSSKSNNLVRNRFAFYFYNNKQKQLRISNISWK